MLKLVDFCQNAGYDTEMMEKMMKNYTAIPLEDLNAVRAAVHENMPEFKIRTFFLGPRNRRQRQTTRSNAYAAKIAVYSDRMLMGYL